MRITEIKKASGAMIKARRQQLDISQDAFSKLVGLSRASIANIERGTHGIDLDQLFLFARKLKTTPDKLLPEFKVDLTEGLSQKDRSAVENLLRQVRYG